jgi:prepilin-type N-terminal cleavage/methylation domain-containing protein
MRRGFSLTEILIGTVILAVVGVPMLGVFISSKHNVKRTDARREVRFYMQKIFDHLNRQPLHDLWKNFGPGEVVGFDAAGRMRHRIAEYDARSGRITGDNPLGFTAEFVQEMLRDGYEARVFFEFFTRKELEITPAQYRPGVPDNPSPLWGILHMQAGWAQVYLLDREKLRTNGGNEAQSVIGQWKEPIMCPAIVGRPGLKLAGCPAVNPDVRAVYEPLLRRREAL